MIKEIIRNVYEIKVGLPGNPLRDLNCYVFMSEDRNLLIDTGFNMPLCLEDLEKGIAELGLDMRKTDLFITHFHTDHCGLVDRIAGPESTVYMSEKDSGLFYDSLEGTGFWKDTIALYKEEGFPGDVLDYASRVNPMRASAARNPVKITCVGDGQILSIGDIELKCIDTAGHTPGHLCLYSEKSKLMVLGDHVLFDITPNITVWTTLNNALKVYLDNLRIMKDYEVEIPLPGHRGCECTMYERIDQLIKHHEIRLDEVLGIVKKNPGINAYDTAGRMDWMIQAKSWDDFPLQQKIFAFGEAIAHLDFLVEAEEIQRDLVGEVAAYSKR